MEKNYGYLISHKGLTPEERIYWRLFGTIVGLAVIVGAIAATGGFNK